MVDWEKIKQTEEARREQGETAEEFFSQLTDHEIAAVLKELPEEYRTAIVLVDIERLSYEAAAEVMECSLGAIRSRRSWGRRMLQVALQNYVLARDPNTVSPLLKVWVAVRTRLARPTLSFLTDY